MLGIDLGSWSCRMIYDTIPFPRVDFFDGEYWSNNIQTYICQIKFLLGWKFSDPELQLELDYVPFRVIEGPDGCPLVHARCNGEDRAFTCTEILAMLISSTNQINTSSDPFLYTAPYDINIGVPIYFSDQQKNEVRQAATIAGLPEPFLLVDETTAMVVAALERTIVNLVPIVAFVDIGKIVAFVDIGHASMQVCFAQFKHRRHSMDMPVNILYRGYARSLGGREFDKILFKHFASKIRSEYNIDVYQNSCACVRLREACETLKHDLSKNYEASFCIEKLSGFLDVKGSITRKEFENLSISVLKKIKQALMKALSESGLNAGKIHFVEAVGGGCSVPSINKILAKILGVEPRTLAIEHIAGGCATGSELWNIIKLRQMRNIQTSGVTSILETVSSELHSEKEREEDLDKLLWRQAMDKGGHLLPYLNRFLEMNMHRIGRSEKTNDETYWINKGRPFTEYSYSELRNATNNFDELYKLGEGGFGVVYMGNLRNTIVAIKMLKEGSQGEKEFTQEVKIQCMVSHPNLVKLIGTCVEAHALIYEYLPNGSLEDRLRCKNNTSPLSWQMRVRIAFEICSALCYLHSCKPHGIVHGDLKPDNVLLDLNDISKICDFGLCRQLDWTTSASIACHWTDNPKGTLAYMDPEYLSTGKTTPQYDNYSFGIMLLRLVTGKEPRGLRYVVEEAQKKGSLKTLIDASAGTWPFKEAKKMISLGLRCSDPVRKNRPDLSTKVLKEMKSMLDIASASGSSWTASLFPL